MRSRELAVAIDIGGTNIKAGLVGSDGRLLDSERLATPSPPEPEIIACKMLEVIQNLAKRNGLVLADIAGVGISIAAFINADGVVTATAHLDRGWVGYDLRTRLLREVSTEYYFALDTPAPTLGEAYYGAGKGFDHFVYVTVSTGIGAGIMADGRYFLGGLGWAGGVGHIIIDESSERICSGCKNHGCLETFAATQGIVATAQELARRNPQSLLVARVAGNLQEITPKLVFDAAREGDPVAREVWRRAGHALGIGLTNMVNIISPQRIVVGGGIAQAGEVLLGPARAVLRQRAFPPQHRRAEVVQAGLKDLSGVYGAAVMVFYDLRINTERT